MSTISLLASILFHLVCNLQVIHFDDYGKLLQRDSNVLIFMEEHIRLRYHLSKISHRFRIYLLLECFFVTVSQIVTLLQVTRYGGIITFTNGGDFAVSSIFSVPIVYPFSLQEELPIFVVILTSHHLEIFHLCFLLLLRFETFIEGLIPFLSPLPILLGIHNCSGGRNHHLSARCNENFS